MKMIGMIVPTVDNSFFSALAAAVQKEMRGQGIQTLIYSCDNDVETEKEAFRHLVSLRAAGIICVSGLRELPRDLMEDPLPLVWVDRVPSSEQPIPWVANDDCAATETAARYLIDRGCRNILLMPGFLAEGQESPRVTGYKNALKKAGIPYQEQFVLKRRGERSSETESEELVRDLLQQGYRFDGIITASDRAAFGVMAGLRSVGLYVPEDVRLISFDNSPYSAMAAPSITSLDRNPAALAEKACRQLLRLMRKETCETETIIPVGIVKRDSTR